MFGKSFLLLSAALGLTAAQLTYPETPTLNWATTLEGGLGEFGFPTLGPFNSVTVDEGENQVYVTVDDGRLVILNAQDGSPRLDFSPDPIDGWQTKGFGGVAFGENTEIGKFAVYSVVDIAPLSAQSDDMSRIFVLSRPSNDILFTITDIPGQIVGTPVTSRNPLQAGGYIYYTHNLNADDEDEAVGIFSIALAASTPEGGMPGDIFFTENSGENPTDGALTRLDSPAVAYGPLALAPFPSEGRFPGGDGNQNEVLYWATRIKGGRFNTGYTRAFQLPIGFATADVATVNTRLLREVRWNHVAPAYVSPDGQILIYGASRNIIRGWTGAPDFDQTANLSPNFGGETEPAIPYTPSVTPDGRVAFVTSTGIMYMIGSTGGANAETFWSYPGPGDAAVTFTSPVALSTLGQYAYSSTTDGQIVAVDTFDGSLYWTINCEAIQAIMADVQCTGVVQASMGVTENGARIFFGDSGGNIISLQVAEGGDTFAPQPFPPSMGDTPPPSVAPVAAPTAPVEPPMAAPVETATDAPVEATTDAPSVAPVMAPTSAASGLLAALPMIAAAAVLVLV